ncbi:MAG: YtxH domain-containing protein [Nitrospirales bacterium]|nr:YtxH domain-containing protein [Nitrospirales bacterium]
MDDHTTHGDSGWVNTFVFVAGFLLGAGTAIMLAPESGSQLRHRLARGAKTAQDEFSDIAAQTKDALTSLKEEAKRSVKQAGERLHTAVDATKQSVKAPAGSSFND